MRRYKYRDIKRRIIECRRITLKRPFKRFLRQEKVSWLRMRPWGPSASDSKHRELIPPRKRDGSYGEMLSSTPGPDLLAASSCMTRPLVVDIPSASQKDVHQNVTGL